MTDTVNSKTLRGLAARFGLRARPSKEAPQAKRIRQNPASQQARSQKKPRLESGPAVESDQEHEKPCPDIGLVTESDAQHLARHCGKKKGHNCSRCKLLASN